VACFEYKEEAESFYRILVKRLERFGLEVAEEKTRIIAFGKRAADECKRQGKSKPDTFDFLGFTHYCGKSMKGWYRVKRKTSAKKFRNSLVRTKEWLHKNLTTPTREVAKELAKKLEGHYQYYGITDNSRMLDNYYNCVRTLMFRWFCRKSQKTGMNWSKFQQYMKRNPLPRGRIRVNMYDVRQELARCVQ